MHIEWVLQWKTEAFDLHFSMFMKEKKKTIKGEDNFSKSFDLLNYNDQNYPDLNISMHVVL